MSTFWQALLGTTPATDLPNIYPFPSLEADFVRTDVEALYSRILTDAIERTEGISEENQALLWDNCLASESQEGLVTMLARAMASKQELFLVHDKSLKVIVKATQEQETQIKADYKKSGESKVGIYITFRKYNRTDMIKIYSSMEFCTAGSLWKSMNLARAIQLKLNDLRSSTGLNDSNSVRTQAVEIATALAAGKDIMLDAKDVVESVAPDLKAAEASETFINRKLSKYTGMPASYITGEQDQSMGDTGSKDAKAVERGLKLYYFSIVRPVLEGLFGGKTTFETEDYASISSSNETLKTFDVTSNDLLSKDNKTKIVNRLFGLPEDEQGDEPEEIQPPPGIDPKTGQPIVPPKPGAPVPKPEPPKV